ncbi:DUF6011 domain-containing protein [Streptomyces sp. NPDC045431]|uniref:DUF6011 domain-containing protein n=1 Tax=Streptomyces sp. NPDC045431 TaxID=3155613 RepID=UPI0033DEA44F
MAPHHTPRQPTLVDDPATGYRHRYCRRCGRELTTPASRLNGYGAACDPNRRPPAPPEHTVDQDPLPGT